MKRIINILLMIPLMWTICSCSTSDITTTQSQDKYVDLYQKTYESLKSQLSETRASEYGQEITAEELESINTLEKLQLMMPDDSKKSNIHVFIKININTHSRLRKKQKNIL